MVQIRLAPKPVRAVPVPAASGAAAPDYVNFVNFGPGKSRAAAPDYVNFVNFARPTAIVAEHSR